MSNKDPYKILGVDRSADPADIKKAYRRLANKYHPDKNQGDTSSEAKFKEVSEAYEILSDPQKKQMFDQFGSTSSQAEGFNPHDFAQSFNGAENLADIFESFFGGGFGSSRSSQQTRKKSSAVKGEDIEYSLKISFQESIFGINKKIKIRKVIACELCSGSGVEPGHKLKTCETCNGQGVIQEVRRSLLGQVMSTRTCTTCNGFGQVPEKKCHKCNGHKRHAKDVELTVKVPKGIFDGATMRIREAGNEGVQSSNGDLFVHIEVEKHKSFERNGDDIYSELDIPYWLAILGGELESETVHGKETIKIPSGIQHNYEITLSGKGSPKLNSEYVGKHVFVVKIIIPKKISSKEKKLLKEVEELNLGEKKGFWL